MSWRDETESEVAKTWRWGYNGKTDEKETRSFLGSTLNGFCILIVHLNVIFRGVVFLLTWWNFSWWVADCFAAVGIELASPDKLHNSQPHGQISRWVSGWRLKVLNDLLYFDMMRNNLLYFDMMRNVFLNWSDIFCGSWPWISGMLENGFSRTNRKWEGRVYDKFRKHAPACETKPLNWRIIYKWLNGDRPLHQIKVRIYNPENEIIKQNYEMKTPYEYNPNSDVQWCENKIYNWSGTSQTKHQLKLKS